VSWRSRLDLVGFGLDLEREFCYRILNSEGCLCM